MKNFKTFRANRRTVVMTLVALCAIGLLIPGASAFSSFDWNIGNYFDMTDSQSSLYRNASGYFGTGPKVSNQQDDGWNAHAPDFGVPQRNGWAGNENGYTNRGGREDDLPGYTGGGFGRGSNNSENNGPKEFSFKEDEWKNKDNVWNDDERDWNDDNEDGDDADDNDDNDDGDDNDEIDSFRIEAQSEPTTTPEPMSLVLLGGGLFGLAGLKRRSA